MWFKDDAVSLVFDQSYNCAEVAPRLDIPSNNVSRWVRDYRQRNEMKSSDSLSRAMTGS
jgi:transposase-like protein